MALDKHCHESSAAVGLAALRQILFVEIDSAHQLFGKWRRCKRNPCQIWQWPRFKFQAVNRSIICKTTGTCEVARRLYIYIYIYT